ncbi:MAG: sporulation protein YunB [Oscillospiraceae bacterium]|nr:sporulation protein YunB [Oscillospiraceae bacterium]
MRKRKAKLHKRKTILIFIFVVFIAFCAALRTINKNIEPKVRDICEYYCKSEINQMIGSSVYDVINRYEIDYNDIAIKLFDGNEITAVDIRTENVNKIKTEIAETINNNIEAKSENEILIPLGNVSEFFIFSGKGPEISIKFLPESSVSTHIVSDFSSAGINQTRHTVSINIRVEAIAVLPTENINLDITSNCILAESILIGDVPQGIMNY